MWSGDAIYSDSCSGVQMLPFPAGFVAVQSSEWLREVRWFLWRLPVGSRRRQLEAMKDMEQALEAALVAGASLATIGTAAYEVGTAAPALRVTESVADAPTAAPGKGSKRKAPPMATAPGPAAGEAVAAGGEDAQPQASQEPRSSMRPSVWRKSGQ